MHSITTSCESFDLPGLSSGMWQTEVLLRFLPLDANSRDFKTFCCIKIFRDLVPNLAKQLQDSMIQGRPMPVCLLLPKDELGEEERIQKAMKKLIKFNQFLRTCYEGVGLGFLLDEKFIVHGAQYLELESERQEIQDKDLCAVWQKMSPLIEDADTSVRDPSNAEEIRTFFNDYRHFARFDGIRQLDLRQQGLVSIPLELCCLRNITGFSVSQNGVVA